MGLSRRFLNLIVNDSIPGVRSLRCIDLARNEFFYPDTPPSSAASTMEQIRLPSPTWSFKTSGIVSCSTLSDRKVFCAGRCGDAFIYDADTRRVVTMPTINRPKWEPISIFVPSAGAGAGDGESDPDGTLFVMERRPKQEGLRSGRRSDQFEAFVYRRSSKTSPSKSWHHQSLPLPPFLFLRGHGSQNRRYQYEIRSYGVLGGGSHIFISAKGLKAHVFCDSVAVTYCLDTVKHTWSKVGEWELPFQGKVEYVPELKLWFGIPDEYAVRIAMDSKLVHSWNSELDNDTLNRDLEFDETPNEDSELDADRLNEDLELDETPNKESQKLQKSEVVDLGSGRFCIPSYSHTMRDIRTWLGAADLSTMDSKPSLVRAWDLDLNDTSKDDSESDETPNKEWQELQKSQLVHLGSGRFCIASSFHTMGIIRTSLGNELTFKRSAVFTGVEVMPPSQGLGEIQMVQHMSKRMSDASSIDVVF